MSKTEYATVVGVFTDHVQAERALNDLRRLGFADDQMGFVTRHAGASAGSRAADASKDTGEDVAKGVIGGGVVGSLIGAAASLLIPGFGPAIAGGILATTIGGLAIGAAAGGIIGSLTHMGVPEEEAHYYQGEFAAGRVIVTVNAPGRQQEALAVLHSHGAYDAANRGETYSHHV